MKKICKASVAVTLLAASLLTSQPAGSAVALARLTPVGSFASPVAIATRNGDSALYVVEKVGTIRAIRGGVVDAEPVLDISDLVSTGLEQGLLGLAFSADGSFAYINYTDKERHTHIVEYDFSAGKADEATYRELLKIEQPFSNHNGGTIGFGPDGYLYIGMGDGGSGGDPQGHGQNMMSLLGKMLRIDPRGGQPYGIPSDNPFVGVDGARPEIWAYGVRNPWKWSFDKQTGDLWIADVGQELWEEVNFQAAGSKGGQNYGWKHMEGKHPYRTGTEPANHTPPVYDYPHGQGCSVTGGYVYRGSKIPALQGQYVFGDFCAGRVWTLGNVAGVPLALETGLTVPALSSFGEDQNGELYAMALTGDLFRIDPLL